MDTKPTAPKPCQRCGQALLPLISVWLCEGCGSMEPKRQVRAPR